MAHRYLCQPAVPVLRALWPQCIESLCRPLPGGTRRERIALLFPRYHLKAEIISGFRGVWHYLLNKLKTKTKK